MNGYALESTTTLCVKCGQNCLACTADSPFVCTSCISSAFLTNSSTCIACDRICTTCVGTPTNCTGCPPGQTFVGGSCTGGCPSNCITCTNSTVCLTCNRGFVVANGSCRGCSSTCSTCNPYNITQCTSCANGLSLVNFACVTCPDKCQTCNRGVCTTCIPGFKPNSGGICIRKCEISCASCSDNQPSRCRSCYKGSYLSGSTCKLNISCNINSTCTDCGQGLGYVLADFTCTKCPNISNCLQCDASYTTRCSVCKNGYYLDSSYKCSTCMNNCLQCISSDLCSAC
jgi:proprotein convertase subtilisin/kexin type 5